MKITISRSGQSGIVKMAESVLSKYPLEQDLGLVPIHIKGQATLSALMKMQSRDYFDVCVVDDLCKLHGVYIKSEHRKLMRVYHCVDWSSIGQEARDYLFALLAKYFEEPIKSAELTAQK